MPRAAHFQLAAVETMIGLLIAAIVAIAAPRIGHHHMVAGHKVAHGGADGMDHAGAFVAVNGGIGTGEIAVAAVQVGLAHAARHHANDHLIGPRRGELQRVDDERCGFFVDDGGRDLHRRIVETSHAFVNAPAYPCPSILSCVFVSKSSASWRSRNCPSSGPVARLTIRPRLTAGRSPISFVQRVRFL